MESLVDEGLFYNMHAIIQGIDFVVYLYSDKGSIILTASKKSSCHGRVS